MASIYNIPIRETATYKDFLIEILTGFNSLNLCCENCSNSLVKTEMILRIINSDYKKLLIVKFDSMHLNCDCKVKEWITKELEYQS